MHILNQARQIRKYGDKYPDPAPEMGKKYLEAMNGLSPDVDGISLNDWKRMIYILEVLSGEVGKSMASDFKGDVTDEEKNTFRELVKGAMANHEATCPPEAKEKMKNEFMAIMQGNTEL